MAHTIRGLARTADASAPAQQGPSPVGVEAPRAQRPYLNELNLLRFLVCIGVVTTHCVEQFGIPSSIYDGAALSALHATREIFFMVSALLLGYHYYDSPQNWDRFYTRRILWVAVPFWVWTCAYFGMSFPHYGAFSLVTLTPPWTKELHELATYSVIGIGHLYFVAVLLQLWVLAPLLMWFLRHTARIHLLIIAGSIVAQIWLMSQIDQTGVTNREIWDYQLDIVVGVIVGARLADVRRWLWRLRWLLVPVIAAVVVLTEVQYFYSVHHGVGVGAASDPFQSIFIPFNFAVATGLYLLGMWWVSRSRPHFLASLVKAGADNSYGVYLSQGVFINTLVYLDFSSASLGHLAWPVVALAAVAITWCGGAALCSLLARSPLAWTVGRARRPLSGSPARGRFEPAV